MNKSTNPVQELLQEDRRYRLEAYQFVSEALSYAQDVMRIGSPSAGGSAGASKKERHLTGQQLCEAIRELAIQQYGLLAPVVLRSWGITRTGDFGEIVYNLIRIGRMKKSPKDRREDFDDVYDFDEVFRKNFRMAYHQTGTSKRERST